MEVVASWLEKYMLRHADMKIPEEERAAKAVQIAEWFGSAESYDRFRTHARPIRYPELQSVATVFHVKWSGEQNFQTNEFCFLSLR